MVLRVEIGGPAHLFAQEIPSGAVAVGTVIRRSGMTGALLRFRNGSYAQMNGAVVKALNRQDVIRAMRELQPEMLV
ncbi:MAG: hypothetical protein WCB48_09870 [Casimicrobiaceae bacterium]